MGCGSSRAVVAVEPCKVDLNGNDKKTVDLEKQRSPTGSAKQKIHNAKDPLPAPNTKKTSSASTRTFIVQEKQKDALGSTGSLNDSLRSASSGKSKRNGSVSSLRKGREQSASSRGTIDSGVYDFMEKNSREDGSMITENSSTDHTRKVHDHQRPPTPELAVDGQKIPERGSGKARHRQALLEARKASGKSLKAFEAPPKRPESVAFDIMLCPDVGNVKKKPERLAQLQQQSNARRKKKSKKTMSKTDIENKLREAEERRKNLEQEKQTKARLSQKAAYSETPVVDLTDSTNEESRVQDID